MGFLEIFSAPKQRRGGSEKSHFHAFKLSEALLCSEHQEDLHDASRRVHRGMGEEKGTPGEGQSGAGDHQDRDSLRGHPPPNAACAWRLPSLGLPG